jgi:hypothetical protein
MGDQSLRDALEKVLVELKSAVDADYLGATHGVVLEPSTAESVIEMLEATRSAEPVGVSDEAVEAAARAAWNHRTGVTGVPWDEARAAHGDGLDPFLEQQRAALEAAQPFMQPQVVGTRPQPTLDRNRLFNILVEFIMAQPQRADVVEYDGVLDQIMALSGRPLPTREQIKLRLQTARGHRWNDDQTADAVLALMGGAETGARG